MKEIWILSTLFFSLSIHAQTDATTIDTSRIKFIKLPDSTVIGTPDGTSVSKKIGPSGGRVVSDDGRVELIFPANALTANTTISIQPVTNPLLSGTGKAYQFEPSGIQFKKPVEIVFHYTIEESETCPADLMNIAMQDHTGKWSYAKYEKWDSTEKTLKGFIHHFSAMSNSNGAMLIPEKKTTIVEGTVNINFYDRYGTVQSGPFVGNHRVEVGSRYWAVNGVREGNDKVGHAGPQLLSTSMGAYTAPKFLPLQNPVVINFFFEYYSEILKKEIWGIVNCKILIYDEYKITIIHNGPSGLKCGAELEDRSSFQARLYSNRVEITDEKNSEPSLTKLPNCKNESRGGRSAEFTITYDPAGCQGPVHVSRNWMNGYTISINNQATEPPDITIEFAPKEVKIMNEQTHYPPTKGGSTNIFFLKRQKIIPPGKAKDEPPVALEDENVGNKIQFKANRKRQEYDRTGDMPKHSFKLIIEPL
jgi:hypothetical protein